MNNISAGEVCCVLAGALVFLFALLHKKFRRLTKVVFVFVMSFAMLLQTVYALSEVKQKENATKALSNTYGDYYGVDINSDAPITVDIPIEEARTSFTSSNPIHFEDDDAGLIPTEDGYVYEEPVDEFASVYVSESNSSEKKLVISQTPQNYETEEEGVFAPIDTAIEASVPQSQSFGIMALSVVSPIYENKDNIMESSFDSDIVNGGFEFSHNGVTLSLKPQLQQNGTPVVSDSSLWFFMQDEINLGYTVHPGSVTEEIIIYSANGITEYSYEIATELGSVFTTANGIGFKRDFTGSTLFTLENSYATDFNGNLFPVVISYANNILTYSLDQSTLDTAVYPLTISNTFKFQEHYESAYSHFLEDSVQSSTYSTHVFSKYHWPEDQEPTNYIMSQEVDALAFLGASSYVYQGHTLGDTFTAMRFNGFDPNEFDFNNYFVKKATVTYYLKDLSAANTLIISNINTAVDINYLTYNGLANIISDVTPISTVQLTEPGMYTLDLTGYFKAVVEEGQPNSGVLLSLQDRTESATFYSCDYSNFYNKQTYYQPFISIYYLEEPEVDPNMSIQDFEFHVRPFVKTDYVEGLAYFTVLGIDGKAPVGSDVSLVIKERESGTIVDDSQSVAVTSNMLNYPNYPEVTQA